MVDTLVSSARVAVLTLPQSLGRLVGGGYSKGGRFLNLIPLLPLGVRVSV